MLPPFLYLIHFNNIFSLSKKILLFNLLLNLYLFYGRINICPTHTYPLHACKARSIFFLFP